jgi:hypothetical protein
MEAELVHLNVLARRLGVPAHWLRQEAEAGRLPHVKAGSQLLFDAATVERILLERATSVHELSERGKESIPRRDARSRGAEAGGPR